MTRENKIETEIGECLRDGDSDGELGLGDRQLIEKYRQKISSIQ